METMTRPQLPAGTLLRLTEKGRSDWAEARFDLTAPLTLVRDDLSALPYYARPTGTEDCYWFAADQMEEILDTFPEPPQEAAMLDAVRENLVWWAERSDAPVLDSVDEQITLLQDPDTSLAGRPRPSFVVVPRNDFFRTGPGKDYVGKVMRFASKRRVQSLDAGVSTTGAHESDVERDRLAAEVRDLTQRLHSSEQRHQRDIDLIGERLIEEARRRDWCSEYDQVISRLNANLYFQLPIRESDYEVTWTETYTVTVHRSGTWEAVDGETATEMATDSEELSDEIHLALRSAGYDATVDFESQDDFSAEAQ